MSNETLFRPFLFPVQKQRFETLLLAEKSIGKVLLDIILSPGKRRHAVPAELGRCFLMLFQRLVSTLLSRHS